ncbi:asparagine synthase-related protein [Prescottella agglutinans]|uniref:asparagine synthase-related protein n=1 Tax=Prescottella agglutinans TaxID=1644129 RepID=UPI003D981863
MALFSDLAVSTSALTEALSGHRDIGAALSHAPSRLDGNCILFATDGRRIYARGPLNELNRIATAHDSEQGYAATSARHLAEVLGRPLRTDLLATRLAFPTSTAELEAQSLWSGVDWHRGGHTIEVSERRVAVLHQCVPSGHLDLSTGAAEFRAQLTRAVAARAAGAGHTGCDVSGGYDSTTIAFLLSATRPDFTAFTSGNRNASDDDPLWADRALKQMAYGNVLRVSAAEMPLPFDDFTNVPVPYEEPFVGFANTARMSFIARYLRSVNVTDHFGGHGGDEVLGLDESYLPEAFRRNPLTGLRQAKSHAFLNRWPLIPAMRFLILRENRATALKRELAQAHTGTKGTSIPSRWQVGPIRFPRWMPADTTDLAAQTIREDPEHLPDSWDHRALSVVQGSGRTTETIRSIYGVEGVELHAPFLDENVVASVLSIRPEEHLDPSTPKALLPASMDGLVPRFVYDRRSKSTGLTDAFAGKRLNKQRLHAYFDQSALVKYGLADQISLHRAIDDALDTDVAPIALWRTIAVESWLRTLTT